MSHCPGCGGTFRQGPWRNFEHILGCGWMLDPTDDNRHAPTKRGKQKKIIIEGLKAAGLAAANGTHAESFIKKVIELIDFEQ